MTSLWKQFPSAQTLKSALLLLFVGLMTACSLINISATEEEKLSGSSYSDLAENPVKTGNPAPEFTLPNPDGKTVSLAELSAEQPVLVLFYRGDWCPFCMSQLDSIKGVLPQLKAHNVQVVAISPDEAASAKNTRRQFGQGFVFLSDPDAKVISQYGIAREDQLPHPAVYLIKQGGEVAWFYASEDYKKRPTGEQLIQIVETRL